MPTSRWIVAMLVISSLSVSSTASARLAELTFDDEADGTGPQDGKAKVNNLEAKKGELGVGALTAMLTGSARRSAFSAGRYGRAAELPDGKGTIEITGWAALGTRVVTTSVWLKPASVNSGRLLDLKEVFALVLEQGALHLEVAEAGGQKKKLPFSAKLPLDNQFHHLALVIDLASTPPTFQLALDFQNDGEKVQSVVQKAPAKPVLVLGQDYQGLLDELLITEGAPSEDDLFDVSPSYCPTGFVCSEEVLASTPKGFPHLVPIRFKSIYDPAKCGPGAPCPLLFDASGGNDCGDDYQSLGDVMAHAKEGFLVVTVDPYCEADGKTQLYPTETSQYLTVKDHLLTKSPLKPLIAGSTYRAAGCSHGAGLLMAWLLNEQDIPSRIYARSPGLDGVCGMFSGQLCPQVQAFREDSLQKKFGTKDFNDPKLQAAYKATQAVDLLTADKVRGAEVAISWGVNLVGSVCKPDGSYDCHEEGLWAMNYGARRFRDYWYKLEEPGKRTGYFVEDRGADCRHCAPQGSEAARCGRCFLKHGRAAMDQQCPECLSYQSSEIGAGKAAEKCTLPASWYKDPLFSSVDGTRDLGPGRDGGARDLSVADRGSPAQEPTGCGCSTVAPGLAPAWILLLGAAALWLRRQRPSAPRGDRLGQREGSVPPSHHHRTGLVGEDRQR